MKLRNSLQATALGLGAGGGLLALALAAAPVLAPAAIGWMPVLSLALLAGWR